MTQRNTERKISYKPVIELKKKSPINKFQSHSLFLAAWIRKQETTNQPMFVSLKNSYFKKKKEKTQTVPEIWPVVFRGHCQLALIILVERDSSGCWNMATSSLLFARNDLHLKGGCWPGHRWMALTPPEVSGSSSRRFLHPVSSLNLPHIQSLVAGR